MCANAGSQVLPLSLSAATFPTDITRSNSEPSLTAAERPPFTVVTSTSMCADLALSKTRGPFARTSVMSTHGRSDKRNSAKLSRLAFSAAFGGPRGCRSLSSCCSSLLVCGIDTFRKLIERTNCDADSSEGQKNQGPLTQQVRAAFGALLAILARWTLWRSPRQLNDER